MTGFKSYYEYIPHVDKLLVANLIPFENNLTWLLNRSTQDSYFNEWTKVHLLCNPSNDFNKVECIIVQNFSPEGMTLDVMEYFILKTFIDFQKQKRVSGGRS